MLKSDPGEKQTSQYSKNAVYSSILKFHQWLPQTSSKRHETAMKGGSDVHNILILFPVVRES